MNVTELDVYKLGFQFTLEIYKKKQEYIPLITVHCSPITDHRSLITDHFSLINR